MATDLYVWISRWDKFQTYTKKRGEPWVPPWIKIYPQLLDDDAFMELPELTRLLLVGLWMLFSNSRGTLAKDTRSLSRKLNQRVTEQQLKRLNREGFIDFCSGTVREQRWNAFVNSSSLEVEVEVEEEKEKNPPGSYSARIAAAWLAHAPPLISHTERVLHASKAKTAMKVALRVYDEEQVAHAIDNYAVVLASDAHYWTHSWTLPDFLKRGLDKFVDEADPLANFKQRSNGKDRGLSFDEILEVDIHGGTRSAGDRRALESSVPAAGANG